MKFFQSQQQLTSHRSLGKGLKQALFSVTLLASSFFASQSAWADMTLDNDASRLSFVTTKADNVAEVHYFEQLRGSLQDDGQVRIGFSLASVNTGIPIRNERMQEMLFETSLFPRATVSAAVDMEAINALNVGDETMISQDMTLDLHGESAEFTVTLIVTKTNAGLRVSTQAPVVIMADTFSLAAGVEKLREVAGLSRISNAVPVTFTATFK